jgi:hypothetical protein
MRANAITHAIANKNASERESPGGTPPRMRANVTARAIAKANAHEGDNARDRNRECP